VAVLPAPVVLFKNASAPSAVLVIPLIL
jgi:hypothetical protein